MSNNKKTRVIPKQANATSQLTRGVQDSHLPEGARARVVVDDGDHCARERGQANTAWVGAVLDYLVPGYPGSGLLESSQGNFGCAPGRPYPVL